MAASVVYTNFGGQIVHENRGGVERRYLADPLGSTIALTDSGTAITDTWDYWPYGEVMSRTGTNPTPFTFVGTLGYFKDLLDKLLYVRARHYKPDYGRWLTVDPIWPNDEAFGYVHAVPSSSVDPAGLQPQVALVAAGPIGWIILGISTVWIIHELCKNPLPTFDWGPRPDPGTAPKPKPNPGTAPKPKPIGPSPYLRPRPKDPDCERKRDACNMAPPPPPSYSCWECYRRCLYNGYWPSDRSCDYWKRIEPGAWWL